MRAATLGLLFSVLLLGACASRGPTADAPAAMPSALTQVAEYGRISVAGQPSTDDLRTLAAQGYTQVINLRLPEEVADRSSVSFDEAALVRELGMRYVALPIGSSEHPFRPEVVDALAQALQQDDGKLLLHCAVGMRASLVYAAYAVKYLNADPDTALRETARFDVWPLALERLSGVPLKVIRADHP